MKKIINQKRYDTDTAKKRGSWWNGSTGFNETYETLYQKKTGEFFLLGEGGPNSRYSRHMGNTWYGTSEIIPMSYEDARSWAEEKLGADDYEAIFGPVEEDGSKIAIGMMLPVSVAEELKRMAAKTGKTQSDIIAELIMQAARR